MTSLDLSSSAFGDREAIPTVYGCDGDDVRVRARAGLVGTYQRHSSG